MKPKGPGACSCTREASAMRSAHRTTREKPAQQWKGQLCFRPFIDMAFMICAEIRQSCYIVLEELLQFFKALSTFPTFSSLSISLYYQFIYKGYNSGLWSQVKEVHGARYVGRGLKHPSLRVPLFPVLCIHWPRSSQLNFLWSPSIMFWLF